MTAGVLVTLGAGASSPSLVRGARTTCTCGDAAITVPDGTSHQAHAAGPLVVVGDLFDRNGSAARLTAGDVRAIVASNGRSAAERFWGRYLLFWRDRRDGGLWAARDPSGAIPLYCWEVAGRVLLFEDPDEARAYGMPRPAVDADGLAHQLWYGLLPTERTALRDVSEILPGQARRFGDAPERRRLWSPWPFAGEELPAGKGEARLRAAVLGAVAGLARDRGPLLLELSGGLDSSIVAAALAKAGADWRAVTTWTPGRDGDERAYAKLIVDRWGVTLDALPVEPGLLDLLAAPKLARVRPGGLSMLGGVDRVLADVAARVGAAALVSGTGGDNVFCSIKSAAPVLDAFGAGGFVRARAAARDLAAITGSSLWTVLRSAVAYAARERRRPVRWLKTPALLMPGTRSELAEHPWMRRPAGARAGTRAHVAALLRAHAVLSGLDRARTHRMLFPLLAQPVMEACLAVPSWAWLEGGRDRAVARAAFADLLPPEIAGRRGKGRLGSLLAPAYDRERPRLRALLLDGELRRLGLLDGAAVEQALAVPAAADDRLYTRVLELADAELWLRGDPVFEDPVS